MPTLEERETERYWEFEERLLEREYDFDISPKMSEYIEMLEVYLLKLENRVAELERRLVPGS